LILGHTFLNQKC